jgi:polyisoprenoid-binding protein YceI
MTDTRLETLTGDYDIDAALTRLGFVARHAMVTKVHGRFTEFEGRAHLNLVEAPRSWATVGIEAASIVTGIEQRDAHLRSGDFLDVPHHPRITFESTEVARLNTNTLRVTGDLTMRGVSRPLTLDFTYSSPETDTGGRTSLTFLGSATLNRLDWGVSWNSVIESGGVLVSEKVVLDLQICVARTAAATDGSSSA